MIPFHLKNHTFDQLTHFLVKVAQFRTLSKENHSLKKQEHKAASIKSYEEAHCSNFAVDKFAFIASLLSKFRRSIVLDHVMTTSPSGNAVLVTDPTHIKDIANKHFQTIADSPPVVVTTLNSIS